MRPSFFTRGRGAAQREFAISDYQYVHLPASRSAIKPFYCSFGEERVTVLESTEGYYAASEIRFFDRDAKPRGPPSFFFFFLFFLSASLPAAGAGRRGQRSGSGWEKQEEKDNATEA
jgi:hypothetical protein